MPTATSPETFDFLGARARVLSEGLVELRDVPAGDMPPLHVHHDHDEGFYVLSGSITLYLPDDQRVSLLPGDYFLAPRGVPHTYRVADDSPASILANSIPSAFENFVAAVGALDEQDPQSVNAVAAEHGIDILGPPGTMP